MPSFLHNYNVTTSTILLWSSIVVAAVYLASLFIFTVPAIAISGVF